MPDLSMEVIPLVEAHGNALAETKLEDKRSSSAERFESLGQMHGGAEEWGGAGRAKPYIIGLTGGIASGKSSVGRLLAQKGAGHVDCDILGHRAYLKGKLKSSNLKL